MSGSHVSDPGSAPFLERAVVSRDDAACDTTQHPPAGSQVGAPLQIVLIGAGHAHMLLVRWWGRKPWPGAQLTLISAYDRFAYSAMVPGALAGLYPFQDALVDLPAFCRRNRVQLVVDRVVALHPAERLIVLAHQPAITFDVASINIGSAPAAELLCQTHRMLVSLKPLVTLEQRFETRLRELLLQHREAGRSDLIPVAIVGGGAAGVELALNLEERAYREKLPLELMLIEGGGDLLPGHSRRAAQIARRLLKQRGIEVHCGRRVAGCHEDSPSALILDDGCPLPCELALWATGAAPPAALKHYGLPTSSRGFLTIQPTLKTMSEAHVFAVGDVADLYGQPLPKAGVYAVRQAKILWTNLQRWLAGQPLRAYRPQSRHLSLLGCGDKTAILDYGGLAWHGAWPWRLKCWIDRRFMQQFSG